MTREQPAHIEPSKHSTDEVDAFLEMVEDNVDGAPGRRLPGHHAEHGPGCRR